jgi:hypothetical protein
LRQDETAGIAAVELEQDSAGVRVAPGDDGDCDSGKIAAPDQRLDPDARFQPGFHGFGAARLAPARRQWQSNPHGQTVRRSIFRRDRPAHRLDIAAGDP